MDAPRKVLAMVAAYNENRRPGMPHHARELERNNIRYDMFDIKQFFPHIHPDELRETVRCCLELLSRRGNGLFQWF